MATYTKEFLTGGAANGTPIKIAQTATAGTTVHTAHASSIDEIWLYAFNTDTTARKLTIEFGGATSPDYTIEITIQPEAGAVLVCPGLILSTSLTVKAFCATANVVSIVGYINRIT
jgi:hypothetical protein